METVGISVSRFSVGSSPPPDATRSTTSDEPVSWVIGVAGTPVAAAVAVAVSVAVAFGVADTRGDPVGVPQPTAITIDTIATIDGMTPRPALGHRVFRVVFAPAAPFGASEEAITRSPFRRSDGTTNRHLPPKRAHRPTGVARAEGT